MLASFLSSALLWQLLLPAVLVSASGRSGYNSVGEGVETTDSGRSGYNGIDDTIEARGGRSGYNSVGETIETTDSGRSGYNEIEARGGRSGYNSVGDTIDTPNSGRSGYNEIEARGGRSGYNSVGETIETPDSGRSGYNGVGDTIETRGRSGYNSVNDTVTIDSGRSGYNKIKRERTGKWTVFDALAAEWSAAGAGVFVLDSGNSCDNTDAVVPQYLDQHTADATGICCNGREYYLLQAAGDPLDLGGKFPTPRGWETVGSASAYATVLQQLVAG